MRYFLRSRLFRYFLSGVLSFTVENLSFLIFYYSIGIEVKLANILSITLALLINFFVSKYFVFRDNINSSTTHKQFIQYIMLVGFNLVVSTFSVATLVGRNLPAYIAKPIVTLFIACWTYLVYKLLIFKIKVPN